MGFFTAGERAELGKPAEKRVQGKIRELGRDDFAPRRRRADDDFAPQRRPADNDLAGDVGSVTQRLAKTSLREIDDLIVVLRKRREELLSESARVQREIVEYAKLSQSTMQSTKIITESLAYWNKVPNPPSMTELHSNEDRKSGSSEAVARRSEDHGTISGQAEATEVPGSSASETTNRPT
jgi:hypothetical protein